MAQLITRTATPTARPGGVLHRGDTVGRYVVLELVGEGAMGRVYASYDPVLDRKVALKLLHPLVEWPEAQERLLREAKALARVSHPHLVGVHDAGAFASSVFIAMEFVDGQTLRTWLASARRTPTEIVATFVQAGTGLAAAHAAGLVHRDFKPENVLVGRDGRIRVSDFGLARDVADPHPPTQAPPLEDASPLHTATGALVGTPAYMAPEQLLGLRADARSDQFGFCVALFEALQGQRPFPRNTKDVVAQGPNVTGTGVVQRALLRGLSVDPEDRFPSMQALLAALEPAKTSRLTLAIAVGVLLATALGTAAVVRRQGELCSSGPARVAAVWTPERRAALTTHFQQLGGTALFERSRLALDAWGAQWATVHREACEATRVRGEQSDQLLAARMACLDRRLTEVDGVLSVLATTDATSLPRAGDAVLSLTPLSVCSNAAALLAPNPRPEQPAVVERVERIEREFARAQALRDSGRFKEGLPIATDGALQAHAVGWAPLEAEALLLRGQLMDGAGELAAAEPTLRDAWTRAHLARSDRLAVQAAVDLSFVLHELGKMEPAEEWVWQAEAMLPRLGDDWEMQSRTANQEGHLHYARSDFAGAEARYRKAWELRRDHQGEGHSKTLTILANVANAMGAQGKYDEAAAMLVDIAKRLGVELGSSHYKVGAATNAAAEKLVALHRNAEALELIDSVLPAQQALLGDSSQYVARLHLGRSEALRGLGRQEEALATNAEALAVFEKAAMPLMVAVTLTARGTMFCAAKKFDEGLATVRRSREVLQGSFGKEHEEFLVTLEAEGECLLAQSRADDALPVFESALAGREKSGGADDPWCAMAISGLGRAQLALGRRDAAKKTLERAVQSLEASKLDEVLLTKTRAVLKEASGP